MTNKAFQDYYPDDFSHCYGCGKDNKQGYQLKSYWDGDTTIAHFQPQSYHTGGMPGKAYGGLIASLLDCHGTASAFAAACQDKGCELDAEPFMRFVTASLKVDFLKPTPIDGLLEIRGKAIEVAKRKVILDLSLIAGGETCATGHMVAVKLPETA